MFIQDLFKIHSRFIQNLFKIYSRFYSIFNQDLCNVHSRFIQDPFKTYSRFFQCFNEKLLQNAFESLSKESLQTTDWQLYAITQQVKWCRPEQSKMHIVRIGKLHTLSCFIAAIGKLWGDGGLRDLLVDSDVYAGSTADLMLAAKQFHRAVRGLTLLYEALSYLLSLIGARRRKT